MYYKKIILIIFLLSLINVFSYINIIPISPYENENDVDLKTIFRWRIEPQIDLRYRIYISSEKSITQENLKNNNLFTNFYVGDVLLPNTKYYWKIEAFDENNVFESEVFEFTTRNIKNGDIYSIFFGNYDDFSYLNNYFFASRNRRVQIFNLAGDIVKNLYLEEDIKSAFLLKENIYYKTNNYIYKITHNLDIYSYEFKDKISSFVLEDLFITDNNLYLIEEKIMLIKEFKNLNKLLFLDNYFMKITDYSIIKYDMNFILIDKIDFDAKIIDVQSSDNELLVLLEDLLISLDINLQIIKSYNLQHFHEDKKIITILYFDKYAILNDNKLKIFNKDFEKLLLLELKNNFSYFIPINENDFVLVGEKIIAFNMDKQTKWQYGTIINFEIIKKPQITSLGLLIGLKDYVVRNIIFYDNFDFEEEKAIYYKEIIIDTKVEQEKTLDFPIFELDNYFITKYYIIEEELTNYLSPSNEILFVFNNLNSYFNNYLNNLEEYLFKNIKENLFFTNYIDKEVKEIIKLEWNDNYNLNDYKIILKNLTKNSSQTYNTQINNIHINLADNSEYIISLYGRIFDNYYFFDEIKFATNIFDITKILVNDNDEFVYNSIIYNEFIYLIGYEDKEVWNSKIWKINKFGEIIFEKTYGGNNTDFLKDIIITDYATRTNDIISIGDTNSLGINGDAYILSIDTEGSINYELHYGDIGRDNGSVIINFDQESYILGGNIFIRNRLTDIFISKYLYDGSRIWTKTFGGRDIELISSIQTSSNQGLMVFGSTRSFGYGNFDIYALRLNFYGNEIWSNVYGSEHNEITIDSWRKNKYYYVFYEKQDIPLKYGIVKVHEDEGFKDNFEQEMPGIRLYGITQYDNRIFAYGQKDIEDKILGVIYEINLENEEFELFRKFELEGEFSIRSVNIENNIMYVMGNKTDNRGRMHPVLIRGSLEDKEE